MAVNFIARKCACGGTLEFNPLKKIWICKYCGTVVEREATFDKIHVDGIEGISDVVRQTLMDVANLKMDNALRNLEDCERKDHKHVGTIIAHISYNLTNVSVAKSSDEARASVDKVKLYAKRLHDEFPVIAEDEINLYESFGEGVADIYANLIVVFETLGDSSRMEYISSKLHLSEVFSVSANKNLLKIAIKHNNLDMVDAITQNIGHIDRKSSLQQVMELYPDNDRKPVIISTLFDVSTAEALTKKYFEKYFETSQDSVLTKVEVIRLLNGTNIHCSADMIAKTVSDSLNSYDIAKQLFQVLYDVKINDQETEGLLIFCLMVNKSFEIQSAFFDTLSEKNIFVVLNGRTVISFLDSTPFSVDEKVSVLQKMLNLQIDSKALDAIYNYYLNNNQDDCDTRSKVIDCLLQEKSPISVNTVRDYIVKTSIDSNSKLNIIKKIFATGLNKTYLGDLLSDYLLNTKDEGSIKKEISDYLISNGFKVDSEVMMKFVSSDLDNQDKIDKLKSLVSNGSQLKADSIDGYIMSLNNPDDFSMEIFNLLTQSNCSISFRAYAKYVLCCTDIDKSRHNDKLLRVMLGDILSQKTTITHNGNSVTCNIAQAYILNTKDAYAVAKSILEQMISYRMKLATEIMVNGNTVKFKKYVGEQRNALTPISLQLCEEYKMFSLF